MVVLWITPKHKKHGKPHQAWYHILALDPLGRHVVLLTLLPNSLAWPHYGGNCQNWTHPTCIATAAYLAGEQCCLLLAGGIQGIRWIPIIFIDQWYLKVQPIMYVKNKGWINPFVYLLKIWIRILEILGLPLVALSYIGSSRPDGEWAISNATLVPRCPRQALAASLVPPLLPDLRWLGFGGGFAVQWWGTIYSDTKVMSGAVWKCGRFGRWWQDGGQRDLWGGGLEVVVFGMMTGRSLRAARELVTSTTA